MDISREEYFDYYYLFKPFETNLVLKFVLETSQIEFKCSGFPWKTNSTLEKSLNKIRFN